jgi:hypothetical protein
MITVFSVIFGFCIAKSSDKPITYLPDKCSSIVKHLIRLKDGLYQYTPIISLSERKLK